MSTPAPSGGPSPLRVGGLALLAVGAVAGIIGLWSLGTGDGGDPSAAPPGDPSATAPELPGEGFTPNDGATPAPGGEGVAPGGDGAVPGAPGGDGTVPGAPGSGPGAPGAGPGGDGGVPVPSFGPDAAPGTGGAGGTGAGGTGADGTGAGGTGAGGTGAGGTGADGSGGTGAGGAGTGGTGAGTGGADGSGGAVGASTGDAEVRMPLRVYNNSTIPGLAARGASDFEAAGWTVTDTGGYNGRVPVSTVYYRAGTAEQEAAETLAAGFGLRAEQRFAGIQDASPGVIVILTRDYQGPGDKNG